MFGVSNQLLAAIALGVGTTVIIKAGRAKYAWTTLAPMIFMFLTTLTASWELVGMFLDKAAKAAMPSEALMFKIDAVLVVLMAGLALIALADMLYTWYIFFTKSETAPAGGLGDA